MRSSTKPSLSLQSVVNARRKFSNFFVMDERTREETIAQIQKDKKDIPAQWPDFVSTVQQYFPSSMLMSEYFFLANEVTTNLGFTDENTVCSPLQTNIYIPT